MYLYINMSMGSQKCWVLIAMCVYTGEFCMCHTGGVTCNSACVDIEEDMRQGKALS
uniref:Uncharacterized protein n=1 Tax=Arion vulgaris TaxID=1028688 RepID=A0A0B7ARJ4_9EUPU